MCFSDGSERRSKRGTITTGYAGEVESFSYKYKKKTSNVRMMMVRQPHQNKGGYPIGQ